MVIVGAALSGSVLVLSLWPPLSANQRGIAVIILSAVLAFHFLLAAGLQLYFFRYANGVTIVSNSGGTSHGHLRAVDSTVDKVTELQPLSLIRAIEDYSPSDTINAETINVKAILTGDNVPTTEINNSKTEQETTEPVHVVKSTSNPAPSKTDQLITKLLPKLLGESTTMV